MSTPLTRDEAIAFLEGRGWVRDDAATEPWWRDGCVAYTRGDYVVPVAPDGEYVRNSESAAYALRVDGMFRIDVLAAYIRAELAKGAKK